LQGRHGQVNLQAIQIEYPAGVAKIRKEKGMDIKDTHHDDGNKWMDTDKKNGSAGIKNVDTER
jgi:hypothetical protein